VAAQIPDVVGDDVEAKCAVLHVWPVLAESTVEGTPLPSNGAAPPRGAVLSDAVPVFSFWHGVAAPGLVLDRLARRLPGAGRPRRRAA
jgi:hypothetical protein